jgi:hypothetical protein
MVLASQGQTLAQAQPQLFVAFKTVDALPVDPLAAIWNDVPATNLPLTAQVGIPPALLQASVPAISVKAIHNGQWIAFWLAWNDATRDVNATKPDQFRDAAAIQLPLNPQGTAICMGVPGQLVNLWHWKADWQEDVDQGFRDVVDAYPNFWGDFYPFAEGKPPFRMSKDFSSSDARAYLIGWSVGNPLSNPERVSPVEDLNAIGFGTAATQPNQNVVGKGVWKDGKWHVVYARPLTSPDGQDAQLTPGQNSMAAFAVWNGSNREVGARKQTSTWYVLELEGQAGAAPAASQANVWIVVAAVMLTALIAVLAMRAQPR